VPHVTIADLHPADQPPTAEPPLPLGPRCPLGRRAEHAVLIVQDHAGRWHTRWRFELGRQPQPGVL